MWESVGEVWKGVGKCVWVWGEVWYTLPFPQHPPLLTSPHTFSHSLDLSHHLPTPPPLPTLLTFFHPNTFSTPLPTPQTYLPMLPHTTHIPARITTPFHTPNTLSNTSPTFSTPPHTFPLSSHLPPNPNTLPTPQTHFPTSPPTHLSTLPFTPPIPTHFPIPFVFTPYLSQLP